jgi:hypothetical protein
MALPTDIQTGIVTGKYTRADGTPEQGTVTFTPAAAYVVSPVTKTTVIMADVSAPIKSDGTFSAVLVASSDTDMVPTGWTWAASIILTSGVKITTQRFVLTPGQTLDITGITTVQTNLGTAPAVSSGGGSAAWSTLSGKPAVIAAGDDAAAARAAIEAGTSNLVIGTTPSTAKPGNAHDSWTDVTGKPVTFPPSAHTHVLADIAGTTSTGQSILSSATPSAARTAIGMTSVGSSVATAADLAAAQSAIGLGTVAADVAAAVAAGNAAITAARLPAGSKMTVRKSGGVWGPRPTTRTDIIVEWIGTNPSPPIVTTGTGGMYAGDQRGITTVDA